MQHSYVSLRLPHGLIGKLDRAAALQHRTRTSLMAHLLDLAVVGVEAEPYMTPTQRAEHALQLKVAERHNRKPEHVALVPSGFKQTEMVWADVSDPDVNAELCNADGSAF